MIIVSPQRRMSIHISCNYSFGIMSVCQGGKGAVIPWWVVDIINGVFAVTMPEGYFVEISWAICFNFFNCGSDVISDVGDDTLAVVAIMVTRSVCVVTYVGVCILVERFLDKGHVDVLLAEKMGQNNLFV